MGENRNSSMGIVSPQRGGREQLYLMLIDKEHAQHKFVLRNRVMLKERCKNADAVEGCFRGIWSPK